MRLPPTALACLLGLSLTAGAVRVHAQDRGRTIPYHALYAPLAAVKQADPKGIVASSLCAESAQGNSPLPTGLQVELRIGATRQALPLNAHRCISLPLRADWADSNAVVWVSQPKEVVKLVEAFVMRTPTTTRISYGQLMESLAVIERLAQQPVAIGGLPQTPPLGVELAWAPGTAQTVAIGTGTHAQTWSTDAEGRLRVPFDSSLPASVPVVLSALPIALQPYSQ